VLTSNPANDFAVVNQGQLKHIAAQACQEFSNTFSAAQVSGIYNLVQTFSLSTNDHTPANLGQLKYAAQPFYSVLMNIGYTNSYPWTWTTEDDRDFVLANIGQVKNLFSFDLTFPGDMDRDGLPDSWEIQYFQTLRNSAQSDTDGDGLINFYEWIYGTNPSVVDTDGDDLRDGFEVLYGFNPLGGPSDGEKLADSDNDGFNNYEEQLYGTNPRVADTDGDGLGDEFDERWLGYLNPASLDPLADYDGDGLVNIDEYLNHTDWRYSDTDHDGISDQTELLSGTDPTVSFDSNTVVATVWVNSGILPSGAFLFSLSFNTNALCVLGVSSAGTMFPGECCLQGPQEASPVSIAYIQSASTSSPSGSNAFVHIVFEKIGSSGMSTDVGLSVSTAVSAIDGTALSISTNQCGITGIPGIL
jgi:hypothetical protein